MRHANPVCPPSERGGKKDATFLETALRAGRHRCRDGAHRRCNAWDALGYTVFAMLNPPNTGTGGPIGGTGMLGPPFTEKLMLVITVPAGHPTLAPLGGSKPNAAAIALAASGGVKCGPMVKGGPVSSPPLSPELDVVAVNSTEADSAEVSAPDQVAPLPYAIGSSFHKCSSRFHGSATTSRTFFTFRSRATDDRNGGT